MADPFSSVQEMDETIIANWNNKVGNKDLTYLLGDFCFLNKREDILKLRNRLKGNIVLVEGNHDGNIGNPGNFGFSSKHQLLEVKIEGQYITLCHYALRVWPKSHYSSWHLYGHSHNCLPGQGKSIDVGVDANNFTPLSFEEIKTIMATVPSKLYKCIIFRSTARTRPHNLNWLEKLPGYNQKEYEEYRSIEMS